MPANKTILLLPGDGIGPEVTRQAARIIDWFNKKRVASFAVSEGLVGGAAIDKHGVPLTDDTMRQAMAADAILLGAVGGPKWDSLPFAQKPERGLLRLRKEMELFANLRPAFVFAPLVGASTLKREVVEGLDMLIVRELTGGVYFGEPRGWASSWRASATTASARSRRPTSWNRACCGAKRCKSCTTPNTGTSPSPICTPTIAPCS
jgi:3-isopropylmalate dehydrogenase